MAGIASTGGTVVADGIVRISSDDSQLEAGLNSSITKFDKFAAAASFALSTIFVKSIKQASDFNKELGNLNTLGIKNLDRMGTGFGIWRGDSMRI